MARILVESHDFIWGLSSKYETALAEQGIEGAVDKVIKSTR